MASMKQDEAIMRFWPKIDFSEENCHGKCIKEHFRASKFQKVAKKNFESCLVLF